MDWNGNLRVPFVSRQDQNSVSFLYNYNYDQFPVLEMKQPSFQASTTLLPTLINNNNNNNNNYGQDPKKKRLSIEQLESLENSFQEEIKLDPDRKMKLAKELGLQPRQIAVWFQNRRARWKGKQLERLYDALKQEYDAVSRDKQKLQQEVMALRTILKDQVLGKKQVSTGHTEISGEETVESSSSDKSTPTTTTTTNVNQMAAECSYVLNVDDYNPVMMPPPPYWPAMPSCP
ncbi:hypothetical protein BUALT_Bualt11G0103700 [Buddleja alternifolia]|uniref:Homeobox-leucine zipper protein n=1 Tax=Buddleja alternifolia TaxID=168488 RepID=A0AAV6X188_9LAMI|nr:hypothetical protein BUALT_Bualt11G0103700 [Buddleja alternifolia]